ncbi:hypothetical protein JAAARDRAFT_140399 [Jaapia argillacea MUCL 33604]|uniref:AB hydrolase-1 domain-containing protein n=1 Tax=Jaapia argillacea MUCL 33604 TaxID=933084 RepID=A0A067PBX4_9AGAM|nr:hypothetical protein JAAARDRAFT_140399 [Jaapia argillacea MUCL 33604]
MSAFSQLLDQSIYTVPSFELESGAILREVPIAYKTWGKLNQSRDNVMIICHAFTGSADVDDWWGPLMGRGKAFDSSRFFIFCANVMGSPYGSASPVTINPATGRPYGPEFPLTSIRDDVRLHKLVLDNLGVNSVAVAIGGSMGGMAVLEWPLCTPKGYVRHIIPIATSARHSAWCISWGEAQRQSIYSDPTYEDGYYQTQPTSGLSAARMAALLTYRSRDSFETRFGRKPQKPVGLITPPRSPISHADDHNDGHRYAKSRTSQANNISLPPSPTSSSPPSPRLSSISNPTAPIAPQPRRPVFSAQSYLRYQGDKFCARFDANCYIHITRKMDTHDLARDRSIDHEEPHALWRVLSTLPSGALVISIQTDGLFTPSEQRELAEHIPQAELVTINSPDGHDGFLLEFEQINEHILKFLRKQFPDYYRTLGGEESVDTPEEGFNIKKTSVFGEAEVDITQW